MLAARESGRADGGWRVCTLPDLESSLIWNSKGSPSARLRKPSAWMLRWCTNTCEREKQQDWRLLAFQQQDWRPGPDRLRAWLQAVAAVPSGQAIGPRVPRPFATRATHIALLVVDGDEAKALLAVEPLARASQQVVRPRAERRAHRREHGRLARPHRERLRHRHREGKSRRSRARGCTEPTKTGRFYRRRGSARVQLTTWTRVAIESKKCHTGSLLGHFASFDPCSSWRSPAAVSPTGRS